MKNHTRDKFQEAKYFLEQMKQAFEDDTIFSYNLSAFLSAARSITFYMQEQYAHKDGFPEWYCAKQIEMQTDPELKHLNKARVEDVHKEHVKTGATRKLSFTIDTCLAKEGEQPVKQGEEPKLKTSIKNQPKTVRRFFPEFNQVDVIKFCENQMNKLKELVQECENQFS